MLIEYDGKTYYAVGYAAGDVKIWTDLVDKADSSDEASRAAEKHAGLKFVKYFFPVITAVLFVLAAYIATWGMTYYWSFLIPIAFFCFGLSIYGVACHRANKFMNNVKGEWFNHFIKDLQNILASCGYKALSNTETYDLESIKDKTFTGGTYHDMGDIMPYWSTCIVLFVLTGIIMLWCFSCVSCSACMGCS